MSARPGIEDQREEEDRRIAAGTAPGSLDRNLFVEAGAGTGKTTLLVERILNILRSGRARLPEVVAITFTEKAAGELLHRLRSALAKAAGEAADPEARRNLEQALGDIERAPISTIHGFAGQLLRERPLEAGLDPGFTPLDQVSAVLAVDEAWEKWFPEALAREPGPVRRALRLGATLQQARELAGFLLQHRDRPLAEAVEPAPPPDPRITLDRWAEIQGRLNGLAAMCEDPGDGAMAQIGPLGERLAQGRRLLEEEKLERLAALIASTSVHSAKGNQKNWRTKDACKDAKGLLIELAGLRESFAAAAFHDAIRALVGWLSGFVDFALAERRDRGFLSFDDYLIDCRDLLRRDRGVRRYFQERYRYLLLDEFQDTDPLQLEIAFFLAEEHPEAEAWDRVRLKPGKLFIVGDPKQSIYRFRRADVELYERIKRLIEPTGQVLKIRRNFRSAPRAIEWVNRTFGALIQPPDDGDYQPEYVALLPHRAAEEHESVLDLKEAAAIEEAGQARRTEAERLARLLIEIAGAADGASGWQVRDPATKELRKASWRDIAVLFPTLTRIDVYEEALRSGGIPYHLDGGKEFFRRFEIAGVLHALDALDRPEDRQALSSTLRSPLFGHTDAELVEQIAAGGAITYLADPPAPIVGRPLAGSLALLRDLHRNRNALSMAEIIGRLIDSTGAACAALLRHRGGLAAAGNLRKLEALARRFDADEGSGAALGRFARWLRRVAADDSREAESPTFEENDQAVRLLTIHKSKGLEFPVVILINLGTQEAIKDRMFFSQDRLEARLGPEGAPQTAGFEAGRERESRRREAERIRLLYVASTRARDRLVVSRIVGERGEKGIISHFQPHPGESDAQASGVSSIRAGNEEDGPLPGEIALWREEIRLRPESILAEHRPALSLRPSEAGGEAPAIGASAPGAAISQGREAALAFGTAVHQSLESVDLSLKPGSPVLKDLCARAAAAAGVKDRADEVQAAVSRALASKVIERARRSPIIRREVPIQADLEEGSVGGKIDLVFEEDGAFTVVDYKTNRVDAAEAAARAGLYREQIRLYARALAKATGRAVRKAVLVFTGSGAEEVVELP